MVNSEIATQSQSQAIAKAELDMQVSTAKAYPRTIDKFISEATYLATIDEETSESCFYCLKRKDKDGNIKEIKGPSIRLAEICASAWGNIYCQSRIVENNGKTVVVEAVAWDLEKNVKMAKQNSRSIMTNKGHTYSADMQNMTINAGQSIALRNAILSVVPRALIDRVCDIAMKHAVGDQTTLNSKRQKLVTRLIQMGVDLQKILDFFGMQSINDMGLAEVEYIIGAGTAIKEGWLTIESAFSFQNDPEMANMNTQEKLKHTLSKKNLVNQDEQIEQPTEG